MSNLAKYIRVVGFLLVLSWAVWQTGVATEERSQKDELIGVLSRRSPVTDYQAAENGHTDCRKNYEDAFLAAVGRAVTVQRTDPALQADLAEVARLTDVLAHVETHCPTPRAPEFTDDGKLIAPPVIPDTTATTVPPIG